MSGNSQGLSLPVIVLIAWQAIDVFVHVATGQVEPIRIAASVIVVIAGIAALLLISKPTLFLVASALIYVGLNALFVDRHGMINPETDSLRLPLFVFIIVTLLCLAWIDRRARRT